MSRYIDADALGLELSESMRCVFCINPMHNEYGCDGACTIPNKGLLQAVCKEISDSINSAPAIEIRHGKWECYFTDDEISQKVYLCSECGKEFSKQTNYCPACGARMDGKNE